MSNEIVDSIRRIVGKPDAVSAPPIEQFKRISNTRSIAYVNNRGDVSTSAQDGKDDLEDKPVTDTPLATDDNDTGGTGAQDGSPNTNADPTLDPDGGEILTGDIKTVYDAVTSATTLGSVSGTYRGTSDVACFNSNPLGEGVEFEAPTGWDSPDDPPPITDWVEGIFFRLTVIGGAYDYWGAGGSPFAAKSQVKAVAGAELLAAGYYVFSETATAITYFKLAPPHLNGLSTYAWISPTCGSINDPGVGPEICPLDSMPPDPDPRASHPASGCCEVTWVEAESVYRGHPNDSECSASQLAGEAAPEICSIIDPSSCYRIERLQSGGSKITPVDASGAIVPSSIIIETDSSGKAIGFYDSSQYSYI